METETTAPEGTSLQDAASRFAERFSAPPEDKAPAKPQPEPSSSPETTQQAPPAPVPEQAVSEEATSAPPETAPATPPAPRLLKIGDAEIPEEEVVKGYLRNADYTKKTQALAEEKRKFESEEAQQIRAVRSQYAEHLDKVKDVLTALHPPEPNWEARAQQVTPEQLTAERFEWDKAQKAIAQLAGERQRIAAQEQADAEQGYKQYVELEFSKLSDAIPAVRNAEQRPKFFSELREFGEKAYGFTQEQFNTTVDSRLWRLLHDAKQFNDQKAKAPEIKNQIAQVIETTGPGARKDAAKTSELDTAQKALRNTGKLTAAADVFARKFG